MIEKPDKKKSVAPAMAGERRELFERLVDRHHMLEVFQRTLPRLSTAPVRVTSCRLKQRRRRVALREERLELVYRVGVELPDGSERVYVLLGTAPEPAEFADAARARVLSDHPELAPFESAAAYVPELELALRFFPLDPALPALAELTGARGAALVAPHLAECRAGAALLGIECELRQYKPFKRAVLRVVARLADGRSRALYVKMFADQRGADTYRELRPLYVATQQLAPRAARGLCLPEPLGYDGELGMLFLAEAAGQRDLTEWLKCLGKGQPLPGGVDLARLEQCVTVAAQAAADLRHSGIRPRRKRTFEDELARLHRDLATLGAKVPAEALVGARKLVAGLERLAPTDTGLVPVHGCFRHKQMVGDEHGLSVIDWDGLCLGQPGLDAATFVCRLERSLDGPAGSAREFARLADAFRREFLARCGDVSARELALCEALVRTQDLLRAFRRPLDESTRQVQTLARAAAESLAQAAESGGC